MKRILSISETCLLVLAAVGVTGSYPRRRNIRRFGSREKGYQSSSYICSGDYEGMNVNASLNTLYDLARWDASPPVYEDATDVEGAEPYYYLSKSGRQFYIRPIWFEALPYLDKPCTRVFSWLSTPVVDDASYWNATAPAVVLVHGGGGTAFKDWCEEWAQNDYGSIAIAVEGQTDVPDNSNPPLRWATHEWSGPYRVGAAFSDTYLPMGQQWMFHAVADTILATSLLRSLEQVHTYQVGVTGVSWGGVITSTVIGFDDRFVFAIPGYGCGALADSKSLMGYQISGLNEVVRQQYLNIWDPVLRMPNVTIPTLWISWPQEFHFPLPDQAATYEALPTQAQVMDLLIPNLGHSHARIYTREENYVFADSIIETGIMWARQVNQNEVDLEMPMTALLDDDSPPNAHFQTFVNVLFETNTPFEIATLISTTGNTTIASGSRHWVESVTNTLDNISCATPAEGGRCIWSVSALLPPATTSWYINACTSVNKRVCISSKYNEKQMEPLS